MDKSDFHKNVLERVRSTINDPVFENEIRQIRADALSQVIGSSADIEYTYDSDKVWNACKYVFSSVPYLIADDNRPEGLVDWLREVAQTLEFMSNIETDRSSQKILLYSSLSYFFAGYKANSVCIANRLKDSIENEDTLSNYFLTCAINVIRSNIAKIESSYSRYRSILDGRQSQVAEKLADDFNVEHINHLYGHAFFAEGANSFANYCLSGDKSSFQESIQKLKKSSSYFSKTEELGKESIVSALKTALLIFYNRSTWHTIKESEPDLLDSPTWKYYTRNIAYDGNIVEFWPAQRRALEKGVITTEDGCVIQLPTSAGKTLIAELCMLADLTNDEDNRCLYVAPYRALVNDIKETISKRLGAVGFRISDISGGFELDSFESFLIQESDVVIATPEKIDLLLRTRPDFFESISTVVIDEGHEIDEGFDKESGLEGLRSQKLGRGSLIELLVNRLKKRIPQARYLYLSAVMPEVNANQFSRWITGEEGATLLSKDSDKPSRQVISKFTWENQRGRIDFLNLPPLPGGQSPFVPHVLERQQLETGELTEKRNQRQKRTWPDTSNKSQTAAMVAAKFASSGPVLVFCSQVSHVKNVSRNLVKSLKYLEATGISPREGLKKTEDPNLESYNVARKWLGDEHLLTNALKYGFGIHYGAVPDPLRNSLERDYKDENLDILVSTSTLGQGVNLPIKTVVIHSLERRWGAGQSEKISKRDFWNICGRAGRANKETEGHIIFLEISDHDEKIINEFRQSSFEPVSGELFEVLEALIEDRISQEQLLHYLDSYTLALLSEEILGTDTEDNIEDIIGDSLVSIKAGEKDISTEPLEDVFRRSRKYITENVDTEERLNIYASTGMRVGSCSVLEESARDHLSGGYSDEDDLHGEIICDIDLLISLISASYDVEEVEVTDSEGYEMPKTDIDIIEEWIKFQNVSTIREEYWPTDDAEAFSEYVSDRLKYKLPWLANGYISILRYVVYEEYDYDEVGEVELPPVWEHLSSFIRYGVSDIYSCWACSLGIESRQTASKLSQLYREQKDNTPTSTFGEFASWFSNLPTSRIQHSLDLAEFSKKRLIEARNSLSLTGKNRSFIREGGEIIRSNVKGTFVGDRATHISDLSEGDELRLVREKDNEYDPNAIAVVDGNNQIGYVEREVAVILSREMDVGRSPKAVVDNVYIPDRIDQPTRISIVVKF